MIVIMIVIMIIKSARQAYKYMGRKIGRRHAIIITAVIVSKQITESHYRAAISRTHYICRENQVPGSATATSPAKASTEIGKFKKKSAGGVKSATSIIAVLVTNSSYIPWLNRKKYI